MERVCVGFPMPEIEAPDRLPHLQHRSCINPARAKQERQNAGSLIRLRACLALPYLQPSQMNFGRPKGILDGTKPASIADKSFGLQVIWEQILAKVVHAGTLKQLYVSHRRQRKV